MFFDPPVALCTASIVVYDQSLDYGLFLLGCSLHGFCVFPMNVLLYGLADVVGSRRNPTVDTEIFNMVNLSGYADYEELRYSPPYSVG